MFSVEEHNPRLRRRVRQGGQGRYPQQFLISPGMYGMDDDGLGDLGISFKSIKKSVSKVTKKVVNPVAKIANKIVDPVLHTAEKIPVLGKVVKVAEKVTGKVVNVGAGLINKIPIVGGATSSALKAFVPDRIEDAGKSSKSGGSSKGSVVVQSQSPTPGGGTMADSSGIKTIEYPAGPDGAPILPLAPLAAGYASEAYRNEPTYSGGAGFTEEMLRNLAPETYQSALTPEQQAVANTDSGMDTNTMMIVGGLALGGLLLYTLAKK